MRFAFYALGFVHFRNGFRAAEILVEAAARCMTGHPVKAFGFATQGGEREIA